MEETKTYKPKLSTQQQFDKDFKPKGAIAFFVLLIMLSLAVWYAIYFLMLQRM